MYICFKSSKENKGEYIKLSQTKQTSVQQRHRNQNEPTEREKIFAYHVSEKQVMLKISNENIQLNKKKIIQSKTGKNCTVVIKSLPIKFPKILAMYVNSKEHMRMAIGM